MTHEILVEEADGEVLLETGAVEVLVLAEASALTLVEVPDGVQVVEDSVPLELLESLSEVVLVEADELLITEALGATGPQGPKGDTGATGAQGDPGPQNLFVQATAPTTSEPTYLWVQTDLGTGDLTFWVEDGL